MKRMAVAALGLALCAATASYSTASAWWGALWGDGDTAVDDTTAVPCEFPVDTFGNGGVLSFTPGKGWFFVANDHPKKRRVFTNKRKFPHGAPQYYKERCGESYPCFFD